MHKHKITHTNEMHAEFWLFFIGFKVFLIWAEKMLSLALPDEMAQHKLEFRLSSAAGMK